MKQLNLNSEITVRLNEYGVERTEERIQEVKDEPILKEKEKIIKLIESQIDENGCLTAPLNQVIKQYPLYCFQSPIAILQEENNLYELNLNSEITVRLNEYGVERTEKRIQEVKDEPILKEKEKIIKLIESQIDENGCLTAPLNQVIKQYPLYCFQSPIAILHERTDKLDETESKSK